MAAEDTTRLIIQVETLLKGLDKTLRGLAQVEAQLKKVASIKVGGQSSANVDRAALAAQRLANQQQRLVIQTQELANRQLKADQVSQRLTNSINKQADAHVRAFKAIQRGVDNADAHVRFFKASEASLAKVPQLDAHVQAFRAIELSAKNATIAFGLTEAQLQSLGNAARSIGQGLVTFGTVLTSAITVPLAALGTASVNAAVQMDSLKRGLGAIVGSSAEASRQLARLTEVAKLPGIGFEEAIQGSIRLQAVGFSAQQAEQALRQFANAIALTGGGRAELDRVTVQLGQLAAKGKVLSQDLRPIIEAAPAVGRALKEAFGTVNADDIAQLTSSSQEFLTILISELEKLPRAAGGARNAFENFRDSVFRAAATVGETLLPALTKLIDIAAPIITALAEGFAALPKPFQQLIIAVAALTAALGPTVLIIGALALGVGRLAVGLAQVSAQLPGIITGFFGLATSAGTATTAMTALRAVLISTGVGIAGIAAQIAIGVAAFALFNKLTEETVKVSDEQVAVTNDQIKALKEQSQFLGGLKDGVAQTADQQERLRQIYRDLNIEAQERVGGIQRETVDTAKLRAEVERLLQLKLQQREQEIATIGGQLADALALIKSRQQESEAIGEQVRQNNELIAAQRRLLDAAGDNDQAAVRAIQRIAELRKDNEALIGTQNKLAEANVVSTTEAKKFAAQLIALRQTSVEQIRQFLLLRQAMGFFTGNIEEAIPILKDFIDKQNQATDASLRLRAALGGIDPLLQAAADDSKRLSEERRATIETFALLAREAGRDFQEALKWMNAFIAANPKLKAAITRQAQIQSKSFEEVVRDALGGGGKKETALATAQAALAKQLEDIAKAKSERLVALQEQENDRLLAENETAFKQQLKSYEAYLERRAELTVDSLDKEIQAQAEAAVRARETQTQILAQATRPGAAPVERVRLQAKAGEAEERALKAETELAKLETKRNGILAALRQTQAEAVIEQERGIRRLAIEYANLQGRVEAAFAAESEEQSRERLQALAREQDFISQRLALELNGVKLVAGEERERLKAKQQLNQQEIELLNNIQRQNDALAVLTGAEDKVTKAKQEQSDLERQLDFQVRFRGLSEEAAIQQRLAGEAKVRDALLEEEALLEKTIASFGAMTPPRELTDRLRGIRVELLGLAELDFATRFRLAQKEFDRLNDARIQRIQEVERAVAHRDISELQGRIAIKAANGEYIGALEQQLKLLQQIAAQSGDAGLLKQAQDAATVAAEVRNATTEVANLGRELQSAAIDELHDAFAGIGRSLVDIARGATTAKEALLDMINRVAGRLEDVLFQRLSDKLFGGLFDKLGGVAQGVGSAGGLGGAVAQGAGGTGALQAGATAAGTALTTAGTTAGTALATGATTAGAALTTSGTSASVAITTGGAAASTSIIAAGGAFFTSVVAAGTAFAAAVAAASGAQAIGSAGSSLAGALGAAATGMFPAVPGGAIHIVEGGHDEAVLTTDPKYATRQFAILRQYLQETKGLWGRIPKFEAGGLVSTSEVEAGLLSSLGSTRLGMPSMAAGLELQPANTSVNLRSINLIDRGQLVGSYLRSSTGERDILNIISANQGEVGRRIGVK